MGHYDYQKDLKEAVVVQKEAADHIKRHFTNVTKIDYDNPTKDYDISCEVAGKLQTFEVKNELMVEKTGNIAIEFQCRRKKSGLSITTADFWVEKIRGEFFLIRTEDLRYKISHGEYAIVKTGGDPGSGTMFYLVKENKFKTWCERL